MPDRPMAELEAMVGKQHRSVTDLSVEAGKVSEFARAIRDESPCFHELRDRSGEKGTTPAPLSFTRTSFFPRYRPSGIDDWFGFDLGFRSENVLHGEQEYQYSRPVVVGDTLSALTTLSAVDRRERSDGATMTFAVFTTEYTDDVDEHVLTSRTTRIEVPPTDVEGTETAGRANGEGKTEDCSDETVTGPDGQTPDWTQVIGTVSRRDFVRYAGASGDFNPIHYDEPYAVEHGNPSVFGQGMLTAGYASTLLTDQFGPAVIERFSTRFESRVWPGDRLTVYGARSGEVTDRTPRDVSLWVVNQDAETVLTGAAAIAESGR